MEYLNAQAISLIADIAYRMAVISLILERVAELKNDEAGEMKNAGWKM